MTGGKSQQKSLWDQMLPMKLVTLHLVTASRISGLVGISPTCMAAVFAIETKCSLLFVI